MSKMTRFKKPMSDINIVPYVDVMLVLLVIFMITTPLLTQGVDVDLPQATAKSVDAEQRDPIIVSVNSEGQYFLNTAEKPEQPIVADDLIMRVAAELQTDPKKQVLVRGDKNVSYGEVVSAMVLLQQAGAATVGLVTESPQDNS